MSLLDSDPDMKARIRDALTSRFDREVAEAAILEKMGGHASLRIYWRIRMPTGGESPDWEFDSIPGGSTMVAMVLAPDYEPAKSAEGPADEELETTQLPFVDVQRYLAGIGVPVPAIEHIDREVDVLLLEDLGDRTFEDLVVEVQEAQDIAESARQQEVRSLYQQALELLVDFQAAALESYRSERGSGSKVGGSPTRASGSEPTAKKAKGPSGEPDCICWRRRFDAETLRWELDHYLEWGVEERVGPHVLDNDVREALDRLFDELVGELLDLDQLVALRDFQSRNLMYKQSDEQDTPWVVIDFQDALVAPYVYDAVALLRDSYIELAPDLVSRLLDDYIEMCGEADLPWADDPSVVRRAFHLQTVQRKLKDAGRFIFIDRQKGNPDFLDYYEPSMRYVDHALSQLPGWDELRDLLHRIDPSL